MSLPILQMPLPSNLSFSSRVVSDQTRLLLTSNFSSLSIAKSPKTMTIRMGGGPRTFPGGVSKWQWKRMQAKKAKQLLRARLARERQVYEMRKRAELSAAVSELERPWEVVEKSPKLFSTTADEQLKVLADRFQKPGGFDLWSQKDGPQLFETVDGVPSARFFPKGVVHSIKPYGRIKDEYSHEESVVVQRHEHSTKVKKNGDRRRIGNAHIRIGYQFPDEESDLELGLAQRDGQDENSINANGNFVKNGNKRRISMAGKGPGYQVSDKKSAPESGLVQRTGDGENTSSGNGRFKKKASRRRIGPAGRGLDSGRHGLNQGETGSNQRRDTKRENGRKEHSSLTTKVFDMLLQEDGSYGI